MFAPLIEAVKELKSLFDGDHETIAILKAANDNQAIHLKSLEDEIARIKDSVVSSAIKKKE